VLRNVFTKTLRDARRALLAWATAIAVVAASYAAFWPTVNTPQLQQALQRYPQGVLQAMNYTDLTSPAGYLASSVFGLLVPLLVAVLAIAQGTRAVAGDEEAGTLELLLANPVSRTRVALQRFAALAAMLMAVGAVLWLVMLAISGPAQLDGISTAEFAAAAAHLVLFGACIGGLAFAVGAATGRRALALGISAGAAVLGYLANGVLPQVRGLEWTRQASPWHWYLGGEPLRNGLQVGGVLLLLGVTAVLVVAGTWCFNRRDLAA
jgi:ABC-2 type transport system permease protein